MSISLGPDCVVFSVPALSLVDCDSAVDVFCVASCCSGAGCWVVFSPFFSSSFLSPSFLASSLGGSTLGLGLFTIGSQVVDSNYKIYRGSKIGQSNLSGYLCFC